jgi:MFS family permease
VVETQAGDGATKRVSGYAWYASVVLALAYMFAQIDRMILNLLVEQIRRDLGFTDTQIGLLLGFAFSAATAVAGIPIAWAADRFSRRTIAGVGTVFWGLMTIACGLSSSFIQLFFARFGLGIGESALTPASYSMLSDLFPREKLGTALGFNMVGGTLGVGLASAAGGMLIAALERLDSIPFPGLGMIHAWQLAFPIAGLPAILIGLWVWSLREPARRRSHAADAPAEGHASWGDVWRFLIGKRRVVGSIFAGFAFLILVSQALTSWFPTMLIREFGWDVKDVGVAVGLILGGVGTLAALASGWLVEWAHTRGYEDACLRIGVAAAVLLTAAGIAAPLASSAALALAFFAPAVIVIVIAVVLGGMAVQIVTPAAMRARVTALYFFVTSLVSGGFGPLAVALLTDHVFGRPEAITLSLAIVAAVFCPLSAVSLAVGMRPMRELLAEAYAEPVAESST